MIITAGRPGEQLCWSEPWTGFSARTAVRRWRLLPVEWTAESGELTSTFKLRRRVVHAKYADVINALYAD